MKLSEHNLHQFTFDEIANKAHNGCLEYNGDVNTLVRFLLDSIDEKVQQEIEKKEARRKELFDLRKPIDEELQTLYKQIDKLKDKQTKELLSKEMSFEDKFKFLMFDDGYSSDMERYDAAQEMIESLNLHMGGYYPFSDQKAIEIMLYKGRNDNLNYVYNSLIKILHLVKPMNKDGDKRFKLFEHTLSEYGIFYLRYTASGEWILSKTTYGREQEIEKWDNLMEALIYCQKHHYYEGSEDGEET